MKKNNIHHIGVRGRRIRIEVQKSDSFLQDDKSLIQKGTVTGTGPEAYCKIGDIVIFNAFGLDKITLNDLDYYYLLDTDEYVLEIMAK